MRLTGQVGVVYKVMHDDIFSDEVTSDPYSYFGQLREEDPVHWNSKYKAWIVTSYEHVTNIMRHPELYSSAFWKNDPSGAFPPIRPEDEDHFRFVTKVISKWIIQLDPPDHTRVRTELHPYFTPKAVERWRPMVNQIIDQLMSDLEDMTEIDLMLDFATPLPVLAITRFMGISEQDSGTVKTLSRSLTLIARTEQDRMGALANGIKELTDVLEKEIKKRENNLTEDLLSIMVRAQQKGIYSRDEVVANAMFMLFAGHETTINLICNGVLAFILNPDQWKILRQDPSMIYNATEECLRYDSPVKRSQRLPTTDTCLGGNTLRKGDRVFAVLSSANRDPKKFDYPEKFNITRHPNPHIAFGGGIHHCLGVSIARMEGQEAFLALSKRFKSLSLKNESLEYQPTFNTRSLKALPVSWR